ncbi:MAG: ABC transporter permease subunit [Oligoflexia bacterium]|nr:ABC transporter permease subunit [Oligoflexia bacterium]
MTSMIEKLFTFFSIICGAIIIFLPSSAIIFLLYHGWHVINPVLLFGETPWRDVIFLKAPIYNGIGNAVVGTFFLIINASLLAIPIGIISGIFLSQSSHLSPHKLNKLNMIRKILSIYVDILSSIPSIIMGLFGLMLILTLRKTFVPNANTCMFLSSFCLALLVLPYIIRSTEGALNSLPEKFKLLGPALGMNKLESARYILLPLASRGILSGIILSIGRIAEDTAVIMLTGAIANTGLSGGIFDNFEALPFSIFYLATNYSNQNELDNAFGAAIILLGITTLTFVLARAIQKRLEIRWK